MRARYSRERTTTNVGTQSRTKQSFRDACDINVMVKRHRATGLWENLAKREPHYGDFSKATDLKTAMDQVLAAQEDFDGLPAEVRELCKNDPEILLRALASPEETAALYDAGLPMAENYVRWEEGAGAETDETPVEETEAEKSQSPPDIQGGE